jgi:hypothetical protein
MGKAPSMAENTAAKQPGRGQGRPFSKGQSGNPKGKPAGSRNAVTILAEKLLDDDAEEITKAVIAAAKGGDPTAMRLTFERIAPLRKGRPMQVDLPVIEKAADLPKALGELFRLVGEGLITPDEASALGAMLETQRRTIELVEVEERLARIEAQTARRS